MYLRNVFLYEAGFVKTKKHKYICIKFSTQFHKQRANLYQSKTDHNKTNDYMFQNLSNLSKNFVVESYILSKK